MKRSIFVTILAFILALIVFSSSINIVFAAPITPSSYIAPVGGLDYNPVSADFFSLSASSYSELVIDSNNTPLTLADLQNGTIVRIYGKLRNQGTYGYNLYYGNDDSSLVLIHSDNSQVSSGSTVLANYWDLDSSVSITEVSDGRFYLKSYGSSLGQCCVTAYIAPLSGPVLELSQNVTLTGSTGSFYRLVDVDYDDVLNGSVSVMCLSTNSATLIYTNSMTDVLGSFESVSNLSSGVFTLNSSNSPTVSLQDGYLAIYFLNDSDFTYRVVPVTSAPVDITVSGWAGFVLSPFYTAFNVSHGYASNYLMFALYALIFFGFVYWLFKFIIK